MSMFNILYGKNSNANQLLASIGIKEKEIPRYRDVFEGTIHIFVFTRCGPLNRKHDDCEEGNCWECQAEKLEAKTNFVKFYGEKSDMTYGTFQFKKDCNNYSDPFGRELGFDNHFLDCQEVGCTGLRKPFKILIEEYTNYKWVFCYCRKCKNCSKIMFKPTHYLGKWEDEPYADIKVTEEFEGQIKNEN